MTAWENQSDPESRDAGKKKMEQVESDVSR